MRVNVYAEELTSEVEIVRKKVKDKFRKRTFYGLRFFLKSPSELYHSVEDDNRSAITIWVEWTKAGGSDFTVLDELLDNLNGAVAGLMHSVNNAPASE